MEIPENLLYSEDHEWVRLENEVAYIGITDFAQSELGDIVVVEIETLGEVLKQHGIFGTVEAVKTVAELFLPIAGKILEINPKLVANPELVNSDPYGEGWMIKIKMANLFDTEWLLRPDVYKCLIGL